MELLQDSKGYYYRCDNKLEGGLPCGTRVKVADEDKDEPVSGICQGCAHKKEWNASRVKLEGGRTAALKSYKEQSQKIGRNWRRHRGHFLEH